MNAKGRLEESVFSFDCTLKIDQHLIFLYTTNHAHIARGGEKIGRAILAIVDYRGNSPKQKLCRVAPPNPQPLIPTTSIKRSAYNSKTNNDQHVMIQLFVKFKKFSMHGQFKVTAFMIIV